MPGGAGFNVREGGWLDPPPGAVRVTELRSGAKHQVEIFAPPKNRPEVPFRSLHGEKKMPKMPKIHSTGRRKENFGPLESISEDKWTCMSIQFPWSWGPEVYKFLFLATVHIPHQLLLAIDIIETQPRERNKKNTLKRQPPTWLRPDTHSSFCSVLSTSNTSQFAWAKASIFSAKLSSAKNQFSTSCGEG